MKDILISGELTTEIRDIWFSSLAFYKNPSRGMLILLSSFIKPNAPKSALLGISSLASTFCSNNPQCGDIAEFNEVLSKAGCPKKRKNIEIIDKGSARSEKIRPKNRAARRAAILGEFSNEGRIPSKPNARFHVGGSISDCTRGWHLKWGKSAKF